MNDDELLTAVRSSLTSVKESLADVHLNRSAEAIRARARGRRVRRGLSGVGAGGLALGVGLGLALNPSGAATARSVHVNLDAWSVDTTPSGTVDLTLRQLRDPALLRQTLADAGVPAIVNFGKFCTPTYQVGVKQPTSPVIVRAQRGDVVLTINPAAMSAGTELSIGVMVVSPHSLGAAFSLIKEGTPLTCRVPKPGVGPGNVKAGITG
ncbi:MAG TPA: hypothetical protein VF070_41470 [Streptosporangiaceae bacterium]